MNPIPEPRFNFSPTAIRAIENLRPQFEAVSREKSGAVVVAWGTSVPHDGSPGRSAIVVSFYTERQMIEMAHHVRLIDGLEVVLFTLPNNYPKFDGKTIDYMDNKGFYFA
jgi:hypothetical protein